MKDLEMPVIGASPLMGATLQRNMSGRCGLCLSNDELNMSLLRMGMLDMAVIDDPEMLMGLSWEEQANLVERMVELGTDDLLHFQRGPRYIRLSYGAQGLGFRYLDRSGARYEVVQTTMDPGRLFASGLSFFLNRRVYEGLERGKGRRASEAGRIKPGGGPNLTHTITAVILKREGRSSEDSEAIGRIIEALQAGERLSTAIR
jgi:hypothetical protein